MNEVSTPLVRLFSSATLTIRRKYLSSKCADMAQLRQSKSASTGSGGQPAKGWMLPGFGCDNLKIIHALR